MKTRKSITGIAGIQLAILFLFIGFSCVNPYKHLANRPPLTPKDSAALLARCIKISPLDTNSTHITPLIPTVPDSSGYFKAIADSLFSVKQLVRDSLVNRYKDTCTSAIAIFNEGFDVGIKAGKYQGQSAAETKFKLEKQKLDSLYRLEVAKLKADYNFRLLAATNSEGLANAQAEKYRSKFENSSRLNLWLTSATAFFMLICVLLWKFRRQARSANNIINDVKNLQK